MIAADKKARLIESLQSAPVRRCQSLHDCALCREPIKYGSYYADRGYGRRAHIECVSEVSGESARPAPELRGQAGEVRGPDTTPRRRYLVLPPELGDGVHSSTIAPEDAAAILPDAVAAWLEEATEGEVLEIDFLEMTVREFEELPEL